MYGQRVQEREYSAMQCFFFDPLHWWFRLSDMIVKKPSLLLFLIITLVKFVWGTKWPGHARGYFSFIPPVTTFYKVKRQYQSSCAVNASIAVSPAGFHLSDVGWTRHEFGLFGGWCEKMTCNRRGVRLIECLVPQTQCCFQLWIRIFSSDYLKRPKHVWGEWIPPLPIILERRGREREKKFQFVVLKISKAPFRLEQHAPPRLADHFHQQQSEHIWWTYS